MIRRPPRSTQSRSSAASDVYKRQVIERGPSCLHHLAYIYWVECLLYKSRTTSLKGRILDYVDLDVRKYYSKHNQHIYAATRAHPFTVDACCTPHWGPRVGPPGGPPGRAPREEPRRGPRRDRGGISEGSRRAARGPRKGPSERLREMGEILPRITSFFSFFRIVTGLKSPKTNAIPVHISKLFGPT